MYGKDEVKAIGSFWIWLIILILAGLSIAFVYYTVLPTFLNMQSRSIHASDQYITTKQTRLIKLLADYQQLETDITELKSDPQSADVVAGKRAQQKSIIREMKADAALIPDDMVPSDIRYFLRGIE